MRRTAITLLLALAPAYLAAQGQDKGQTPSTPGSSSPSQTQAAQATTGFSATTQARLEAMLQVAAEQNLPTGPITSRIAEGRAKGASEAQILVAAQRTGAELRAAQQAMLQAGRPAPSAREITAGAALLAQGMSSAQLEVAAGSNAVDGRLAVGLAVPQPGASAAGSVAGTLGIGVIRKP